MKIRALLNAVVFLAAMALFGCGGGGGGGTSPSPTGTEPPPGGFKAGVLTISTASTSLPAGTTINGIDMTITLPAGVTVKADAVSGAADPTILVLSGAAAALTNTIVSGKYDK